ncbi:RBBP9/YdeN family alpha/beta hydrolase [Diaphorobacter aerolatus]|uniref:Serine hydrolase family protein n=1 Tax=Diaphorobacter aerolatus TaxID=1288495 RepID=A0A7H0GG55_9BURK|nr:alpha/beta fold hydrolase [Diaphorobacter aerolatus]QNP47271.1 serine hydrolase family protein [Diaphorobacter aerolatus]
MNPANVLVLPGWQGSGEQHWQSRWEALHGYRRVEQHDWQRPLRGDWSARLEETIVDAPEPVILVAHSLGCILTAWWAAHSRHTAKVRAALLVAPGDVERPELAGPLHGWQPVQMDRLPFPGTLVASRDDPYCTFTRARALADAWGSRFVDLGEHGHINAESGLGDWPEGHAMLDSLKKNETKKKD